jgi:histidinol phosphatase-like PHP family hydrolase
MKITSDWHIHSRNSCDSACMEMEELIRRAKEEGITDFGITDHLHTPYNWPDIEKSRQEYLTSDPSPRFHFGIEVSCVSQWEIDEVNQGKHAEPVYGLRTGGPAGAELSIALTAEAIKQTGIEYVVGGCHWPMYVPWDREAIIREFHRQNMFLANHPLVNIIAHPWWWHGHWEVGNTYPGDPWLDDFRKIPSALHDEFASAVVKHGKAVEINLAAMLLNTAYPKTFTGQYLDYLARLKAHGVVFSIGSDCHTAHYEIDFKECGRLLDRIGLRDEECWRLPPKAKSARS